jgi:glutaredoxin 3
MAKVLMYCTAICPYCDRAERLLKRRGVLEIEKIRVDLQPELRAVMMVSLDQAGGLDELLSNSEI